MLPMAPPADDTRDHRVLVVEDGLLAAEALCDLLRLLGCRAVGPASRCAKAFALLNETAIDFALLDVTLNGETSFPIADELRDRGIPFAFLTGYTEEAMFPPGYRHVVRLGKPVDADRLKALFEQALGPLPG
jgi:CheY-like chemotaxis protein